MQTLAMLFAIYIDSLGLLILEADKEVGLFPDGIDNICGYI
jgi:hypothetical protein